LVHGLDKILVLKSGTIARFGATSELLPQLLPNVGVGVRA
jgi:ABC-type protease/lipase transport system fused ATPase/permease subunit